MATLKERLSSLREWGLRHPDISDRELSIMMDAAFSRENDEDYEEDHEEVITLIEK